MHAVYAWLSCCVPLLSGDQNHAVIAKTSCAEFKSTHGHAAVWMQQQAKVPELKDSHLNTQPHYTVHCIVMEYLHVGACSAGNESHAGQVFTCVAALSIADGLHHVDQDLLSWW